MKQIKKKSQTENPRKIIFMFIFTGKTFNSHFHMFAQLERFRTIIIAATRLFVKYIFFVVNLLLWMFV